jgi:hypothetical protein
VATDRDRAPLLLSDLSEHAKNLQDDDRASLLFDATAELETRRLAKRARDHLAGAGRGRG